jgi:hypothetical protein
VPYLIRSSKELVTIVVGYVVVVYVFVSICYFV